MRRKNGDLIEQPLEPGDWSRECDDGEIWRGSLDCDASLPRPEGISRGRMGFRIHEHAHGVAHVFGTEWRAVREMNPFAQMEGDCAPITGDRPRRCQGRF